MSKGLSALYRIELEIPFVIFSLYKDGALKDDFNIVEKDLEVFDILKKYLKVEFINGKLIINDCELVIPNIEREKIRKAFYE